MVSSVKIENWKSFVDTGEVGLDKINVLVGRNNSGKSAFLRALHLVQQGLATFPSDVRLEAAQANVVVTFSGDDINQALERHYGLGLDSTESASIEINVPGNAPIQRTLRSRGTNMAVGEIQASEPGNYIYTYLSKRKVNAFTETINLERTRAVEIDLRSLNAKVNRLVNPDYEKFDEYTALCKKVLGFRVSSFASNNGHQSGLPVGQFGNIPLEFMGEGVSSQLGLITNLCMANGNLFLIEEPENDIHPESLKALLDVIIEKSATNQFIVTTHSNIVLRYLGAVDHSRVFSVESEYVPNSIPTSTIREVEKTPEARIEVLRQLGYELADFDFWDGWLILEESSAQIIMKYLIPWFVPRLARIQMIAAGGVDKAEPMFEDFRRLFLFSHLEPQYKGRAWVVVDGDDAGKKVTERLKAIYTTYPADHFRTWQETDFERYYPARFAEEADEALKQSHSGKRKPKEDLIKKVRSWCDENPEEAQAEFAESATEVIALLREIDSVLFD